MYKMKIWLIIRVLEAVINLLKDRDQDGVIDVFDSAPDDPHKQ
jgi:hypothetical protein